MLLQRVQEGKQGLAAIVTGMGSLSYGEVYDVDLIAYH